MATIKTMAVSYLRVSGRAQVAGDGLPRQRAAIAQYAKANSLDVVDEFRDEGVSGTREAVDRPGLTSLIERVVGNGVRVVLIERADRLARDLIVGEYILDQLRQQGVKVVAVDSGADLTVGDDDPTRVLIRQVLGAVSQFEKSVIVAKLRAARDRKRRTTGRCEGAKPFGALPSEQQTLARLFALRRKPRKGKRLSFERIAKTLNEENRPTRFGRPWRASAVQNIVNRGNKKVG